MGDDTVTLPLYLRTVSACYDRWNLKEYTHASKRGSIAVHFPFAVGTAEIPAARHNVMILDSNSIIVDEVARIVCNRKLKFGNCRFYRPFEGNVHSYSISLLHSLPWTTYQMLPLNISRITEPRDDRSFFIWISPRRTMDYRQQASDVKSRLVRCYACSQEASARSISNERTV